MCSVPGQKNDSNASLQIGCWYGEVFCSASEQYYVDERTCTFFGVTAGSCHGSGVAGFGIGVI